jgi:poly(hydroxyalkanoate) depolymerase family esterase
MKRMRKGMLVAAMLPLIAAGVLLGARPAMAASLTQVTGFGNNPSNLSMFMYVPDRVAARPALLVLVHYCGGSASAIFNGNGHDYVTGADRFGYIIVLPQIPAGRSLACFDVSTPQALRRDGGSDSTGIASMVAYTRSHFNIDPGRIVVSGFSSGAMMTNVLAAQYPDVFSAGSAFSGVPAGCFGTGTSGSLWNSTCSGGADIRTAQQWGDLARSMFPGYTGSYPRMQLWHGTTDTTLAYPNFGEEVKQWTNLRQLSQTPGFTDHPQSTWTRTRYGDTSTHATVEGISIAGVGHQLPMAGQLANAISFLGLDSGTPPTTTPPTTAPTTAPPPTGACAATYHLDNSWGTGFQATVTVRNNGATTLNGWTVRLTLATGQAITNLWGGVNTGTSGAITVRNASYNATLPGSGSTTFGYVANGNGATAPNGVSCTSP